MWYGEGIIQGYEENLSDVATRTWSETSQMFRSGDGDVVVEEYRTEIKKMCSSFGFMVMIMLGYVNICEGRISDKRLCGDPTCSGLYIVRALLGSVSCMLRTLEGLKIIH
jgi:hypothetical protein